MIYTKNDACIPGWIGNRRVITTPQGGNIVVDAALLDLWERAHGRELDEIITISQAAGIQPEITRCALTCLAEAGFLSRQNVPSWAHTTQEASSPIHSKPETAPAPLVSIIIVNYNSLEWLKECLPSISSQRYIPIEIILVDNGSNEDIRSWIEANFPSARTLFLDSGRSLAFAINRGVGLAKGEYFLFLNPDIRLETDTIAHMVTVVQQDPACAGVAAKLKFWWAPAFLNGLGNQVGAFSWGRDNGLGHLDLGQFDGWSEVPSACFAATLVQRSIWEIVGTVDEGFPMYYEDTEWSYRARLFGYTIRAAPQAVAYHALGMQVHSGVEAGMNPNKLRRVIYGRLRFATRLASPINLFRLLINDGLEDIGYLLAGVITLNGQKIRAVLGGWGDYLNSLSRLLTARRSIQASRRWADRELFALQRQIPPPIIWRGLPELTIDLIQHHYLPLILAGKTKAMPEFTNSHSRPRLLIICHDVVDSKMAGPGMRYMEISRALAEDLQVTLATPGGSALKIPGVRLAAFQWENARSLQVLVEQNDIVLLSSVVLNKFPFLEKTSRRVVADLYDPVVLENLHIYQNEPIDQQEILNISAVDSMNRLIRLGDFFICGNIRQQDFWIGVLTANERVNPRFFKQDPSFGRLIDVVGVGFPDRPPQPGPILRGIHPAFQTDTKIVLWGGGIWDWLDPLSLVRAWHRVLTSHPEARLVFLGTRHPNPLVPPHKMAQQTEALATEIGEKDKTIFFIEWLSYEEREGLLCEADIGVSLHTQHVETRYSIRTRVLDYFWARLPVVVTDGDVTSEWVTQFDLGRVVPAQDAAAVAEALTDLLNRPKGSWEAVFDPLHELFTWSKVVEPLRRYCLGGDTIQNLKRMVGSKKTHRNKSIRQARLARARFILRSEGPRVLFHRIWKYLQWRLSQIR